MPELASPERRKALLEVLGTAALVTALATVASAVVPNDYVASAVGAVFLGATFYRVFRKDDDTVQRFGLAFGGIALTGQRDGLLTFAKETARASLIALLFALLIFGPFTLGWKMWWAPHRPFVSPWTLSTLANELAGQLFVIALPEEAFYRGYMTTRLDDVWPKTKRILGANIGLSLPVTSAIFALGHVATIHHPSRLAVFFPALVFGWLRARTGGVGASIVFHAMCNVFSETLGHGYGLY